MSTDYLSLGTARFFVLSEESVYLFLTVQNAKKYLHEHVIFKDKNKKKFYREEGAVYFFSNNFCGVVLFFISQKFPPS
ncbi:hypothetical protein TDB9533_03674 [Thalassocella blandensis]|nr:hypothetical protein TDB9533_03674 [Thalassocella blandensis]